MNHSKRSFWKTLFGPVVASLLGLGVVLLLGLIAWGLAKGVGGIIIGTCVAATVAALLRWKADWPMSMAASALGAMIACYGAIATAEALPPGSVPWAWKGGLYGASFGIPVALILSSLGLLPKTLKGKERGTN